MLTFLKREKRRIFCYQYLKNFTILLVPFFKKAVVKTLPSVRVNSKISVKNNVFESGYIFIFDTLDNFLNLIMLVQKPTK